MQFTQIHRPNRNLLPRFRYVFMMFTILLLARLNASAKRIYVDVTSTVASPDGLSWPTAYSKFEDAVTAAVSGDVIWVAKGTYQPAYQASYTLKDGVEIYGGFTNTDTDMSQRDWENNVTTLKGNGSRVFTNSYVSGAPVLDGFTISDGINGWFYGGGGMCNDNSSPILNNIIFKNNHVVHVTGDNHSLAYGGGMFNTQSSPILTNVKFINNSCISDIYQANGGGMYNQVDSNPVLNNVIFSGNRCESTDTERGQSIGGGVFNGSSSPVYNNVVFEHNVSVSVRKAYGGGIGNVECPTQSLLTNVVFDGNEAETGGALYSYKSNVIVVHATVANHANTYAFIATSSTTKVSNSVFFNNMYNMYTTEQVSTIISNSFIRLISNEATVSNNIQSLLSPFVNEGNPKGPDGIWLTADDGLRLAYDADVSPIDKAETVTAQFYPQAMVSAAATDIRGIARPQGTAYDMGAYEGGVEKAVYFVDASNTAGIHDGKSWATAFDKLEDALDPAAFGAGGAIWVAKGTYQPAEGKSFTLLPLSRIYGGFKNTDTAIEQRDWVNNKTILQGNGSHVISNDLNVTGVILTSKSELDGFTITGGKGGTTGGGGMYNYSSSPTISNSIFDQNEAEGRGGAVYNVISSPWFRNVSFTNNSSKNGDGGAIYNDGGSTAFDNVIFSNNKAENGYGGAVVADRGTMVMNNTVFESNKAANGGAISSIVPIVDITNAVFVGNEATTSSAVMYNGRVKLHITHATFLNNIAPDVLISENSAAFDSYTSIINSVFKGGTPIGNYPAVSYSTLGTIRSGTANEVKTTGLFVNENLPKGADGIWFTEDDGLRLTYDVDTSPATAINSGKKIVEADGNTSITDVALKDITGFPRPSGMGYDKGAYEYRYPAGVASHLYVDASNTADLRDGKTWARAYNKLDLALADPLLSAGNEVWVAKGTYQPPTGSSFIMKEGVGIYGGLLNTDLEFSNRNIVENPTILQGNGKSVINNTFTEGTAMTGAAVLDGFTIQDGTSDEKGGGINNVYASPTLQNLIVKDNTATYFGGGIALTNSSSQLLNVKFENNQAELGAGMDITSSTAGLINVIFSKNTSVYGGGGINSTLSGYQLLNVVFDRNKATDEYGGGGGVFSSAESGPTIFNNVIFYGNEAPLGGGIAGGSANSSFTNVTFYKNEASMAAGALSLYSTDAPVPAITNCVFWGNTNPGGVPDIEFLDVPATVNYNFTQSDFSSGGTGNIQGTSSPFVNESQPMGPDGIWFTEDDGLQLSICSPALDKGNNTAAADIYIDVLERPRKHNTTVDMGAYEKQSNTTPGAFGSNAALSQSSANELALLPTCEDIGWTFYADPTQPDNFIFAIHWGTGNETAKAVATVKITLAETNTSALTTDNGIVAMRRYWNVDLHAATLVNPVKVRFYYDAADVTAMESTVSNASLFKKDNEVKWFKTTGNLYVPTQITATDINAGARLFLTPILGTDNGVAYAQFDQVSSFSGGTAVILAEKEPSLPVTLTSFQAKNTEDGSNLLTWNTVSEDNFSHFEVEHSISANAFTVLGKVPGQHADGYQYTHVNPPSGFNYYRLRMVDTDGSFAYSRMVYLTNKANHELAGNFYPNPAAGKNAFIDITTRETDTWQTQIFTTAGVLLKSGKISLQPGFNKIMIDIQGLPEGIHLVKFRDQYQHEVVRKIVIE